MSAPNLSEKLLASVSRDFFRPLTRPSAAIYVDCAERLADVAGEAGRIPHSESIALIREATPRHVGVFQMKWRPATTPSLLTPYDRKLLPKLLDSPLLSDVRPEITMILEKQDRGDFEQETIKPISPRVFSKA